MHSSNSERRTDLDLAVLTLDKYVQGAYMWLWYYLAAINAAGIAVMGIDKQKAKRRLSRVSEKSIFTLAAVGGALGVWLGMSLFRHKTKHKSFSLGIPALLMLNILMVYLLFNLR